MHPDHTTIVLLQEKTLTLSDGMTKGSASRMPYGLEKGNLGFVGPTAFNVKMTKYFFYDLLMFRENMNGSFLCKNKTKCLAFGESQV